MGTGGGGVLTLYLSVFSDVKQLYAQGVNLFSFAGALSVSAVVNTIRYKPEMRIIAFLTFCAAIGCVLGSLLSPYAPNDILRRICGAFLTAVGFVSLVKAAKEAD